MFPSAELMTVLESLDDVSWKPEVCRPLTSCGVDAKPRQASNEEPHSGNFNVSQVQFPDDFFYFSLQPEFFHSFPLDPNDNRANPPMN